MTRRCKASSEASARVHFPARARAIWNRHLRKGRGKPVQRCLLESICLHGLGEYGIVDKARPCKTISNQLGIDNFLVPELRGDVEARSFDKALDFLMILRQVSVWRCHCLLRSVCSCQCMFGAVCLDVNFWFASSGDIFQALIWFAMMCCGGWASWHARSHLICSIRLLAQDARSRKA